LAEDFSDFFLFDWAGAFSPPASGLSAAGAAAALAPFADFLRPLDFFLAVVLPDQLEQGQLPIVAQPAQGHPYDPSIAARPIQVARSQVTEELADHGPLVHHLVLFVGHDPPVGADQGNGPPPALKGPLLGQVDELLGKRLDLLGLLNGGGDRLMLEQRCDQVPSKGQAMLPCPT